MENIANVTDRHSLIEFLNSLNYQTEECRKLSYVKRKNSY